MGGYFAGLLNRTVLETSLDHETMRRLGSGLGCGAISVITDDCPVAVAASVLAYFDRENAGQCGSCFNGTAAMAAAAGALRDDAATKEDVDRLRRWSVLLRGRGACATLDAATNVAASLLDQFPGEVTVHLDGTCQDCTGGDTPHDEQPGQVARGTMSGPARSLTRHRSESSAFRCCHRTSRPERRASRESSRADS